jgi:hypothetical protein
MKEINRKIHPKSGQLPVNAASSIELSANERPNYGRIILIFSPYFANFMSGEPKK